MNKVVFANYGHFLWKFLNLRVFEFLEILDQLKYFGYPAHVDQTPSAH